MANNISRLLSHVRAGILDSFGIGTHDSLRFSLLRKYLNAGDLKELKSMISSSEAQHRGELRLAIETKLPLLQVWSGKTAKMRAVEMFSFLRVWDTEENTGILIYLLLAEKKIVLLADRGIYKKIGQENLDSIANEISDGFKESKYKKSLTQGIQKLTEILKKHFPAQGKNPNELPDEPYIV
ncbi:PF04536 family protein [Leptospira fainei serovar Hurstbridge str. BUT 6]|uniref:PF04536 family protein n=1 Tax=Leptospira fainei serovar Hurstbridge str. BUT 6 TaxID=1193011 RepID=S3V0C9_9LEPT|nr:TPM domain-containing protein [Leptospira fainei]EPG74029.1 PF04536 family protein [Leptospira fainei serovar Hurstbridge str. BUT 6]